MTPTRIDPRRGLDRRRTLLVLGGAGAATLLPTAPPPAVAQSQLDCVLSPEQTLGPYWLDERLNRSDIRQDPVTGVVKLGLPLRLRIAVYSVAPTGCAALPGAYVDIWHCDAGGLYSGFAANNSVGQKFLRGYQVTDANGAVEFVTIYPGWYSGRTVHIHLRVRTFSSAGNVLETFTSQVYFDDTVTDAVYTQAPYSGRPNRNTRNANDNIYNGQTRMLLNLAQNAEGYSASINVGVNMSAPPLPAPSVSAGGVAEAAGYRAAIAPGGFVSIFGQNLAAASWTATVNDLVAGSLPTQLAGVGVQIDNRPAYLAYVSPTQINAQAPDSPSLGPVSVAVTNASGTSPAAQIEQRARMPGLFAADGYVAAVRADGVVVTGSGASGAGTVEAARAGDTLQIYGTGFGTPSGSPPAGRVFTGSYPLSEAVSVLVGGVEAAVAYAGLVAAGLHQINIAVPALAPGDHEIVARIAGQATQSGVRLKIAA